MDLHGFEATMQQNHTPAMPSSLFFFEGEDLKACIYVSPLRVTKGGEKNKILRKKLKKLTF